VVELRVLGPLEVVGDDGEVVAIPGTKLKALLAVLALRAGDVVPTGRIVEDLWEERDVRNPANAVQVLVSKLRRVLLPHRSAEAPPLIVTSGVGYSLQLDREAVDAIRFERLVDIGRTLLDEGHPDRAAAVLVEASELWRGPALADFVDDRFAHAVRVQLEELRAGAVELRLEAELARGRHEVVANEVEKLIAEQPLRERLRAQQMLALYRSGRQADALRAYQSARTVLGEELGIEPGPELRGLEAAILAQDPALDPPRAVAGTPGGNLPVPISSFVGRSTELEEVLQLLDAHRLVTLVGPGGVGKSRLALEAAARARTSSPGGSWLIELAPLVDPSHVENAAAAALGIDDPRRLEGFLADRQVLIVLDNCEHLVEAAAALASRLLHAGPGVTVLATSREVLGVTGERRWVVPPLAADDAHALFHDRAADPGSADRQREVVEEICARLDGLPLAVELAAARTRTLSLQDIATRIDDRFRLLTGGDRTAHPRQQTLRRVVDWSYDLLFTDEQRVLRRLSVFSGGFGLPAAELVTAGDDLVASDVVDIIGHLVDKSLVVVVERHGVTRYQLLQTIADYALEKLAEADEEPATRDRHLTWIVELAASAEPALRGPNAVDWAAVLDAERDNIRSAVEWAVQRGRMEEAVAAVAGFAYGWYISGAVNEGRTLLEAVLASAALAPAEPRAVAHAWAAWLTQFGSGATDEVVAHAERAVELARGASSRVFSVAAVLAAMLRAFRGLTDGAVLLTDEAVRVLERQPDRWGQAWLDWARSGLVLKVGDPEGALALLRRSFAGFDAEGDRWGAAIASMRLSELAEGRGDLEEARAQAMSAYGTVMAFGARTFNASTLATRLGGLAALEGQFEEAEEWHAIALARAREGAYAGALAQALSGMANTAFRRGKLDEAEAGHREALATYAASGSVEGAASSLASLGFIATARGDQPAAIDLHLRSLREAARGRDRRAVALALEGLAGATAAAGDARRAAALLGAAAEVRRTGGGPLPTAQEPAVDRTAELIASVLVPAEVAAAQREGADACEEIVDQLLSEAEAPVA
jgi:predicted ATPase/DNA-binding SARP family transcriptional activator